MRLYAAVEAHQNRKPRNYLGMSSLGEPCDRRLWLDFRQAKPSDFPAKTLAAFEDGHYSEDLTAERLRLINGVRLITHNDHGEQIGFVDFGGHFRGHMDGQILGLSQAPSKWHVWEHKCSSEQTYKRFRKLLDTMPEKEVLEAWNYKYYAQAQLYMLYAKSDRHYLTVALAGSREYQAARTEAKPSIGKRLRERARDIIASDKALDKVTEKIDSFDCKFCSYKEQCHGTELPTPNCRTCIYSYPVIDGSADAKWHCQRYKQNISPDELAIGCTRHVYIPQLLENIAKLDSVDRHAGTITYKNAATGLVFTNGDAKGAYTSRELFDGPPAIFGEPLAQQLKEQFDAKITGGTDA